MVQLKVLELFSGTGSQTQALKNIGIEHISTQCEIDKYAIDTYNQLHGQTPNLGDISKVNPNDLHEGQWDLITYSSPCQDFSICGLNMGGDKGSGTRSSLLFECEKIIRKVKPKYLLFENVKNLLSEKHKHNFLQWLGILKQMGYTNYYTILNAKDFGIPQNRERVFCVSILGDDNYFEFPQKQPLKLRLKDMLEDSVDEKYYIKKELTDKFVKDLKNKQISNSLRVGGKGSTDQKHAYDLVAVSCAMRGRNNENGKTEQQIELNSEQTANCITTAQKDSMIIQVGNLYKHKNRDNPQRGRVYEPQGISPALNTCQGGGLQPHIIIDQKVKNSVAKNFEREKDAIANSKKEIYQAKCESGFQDNKIGLKVSPTIRANNSDTFALDNNFRIRKLSPRECWRLMGWKDEQFDKAAYKKEIYYLEGDKEQCNVNLKIVAEKQRHIDMETYVLCTIKDMQDMEILKTIKKLLINKPKKDEMQNVNIVIEKLEKQVHLACATNIIKCFTFMGIHYTLMEEKDQHRMVIIAQAEKGKENIEKYMKITTELNLSLLKLYTILILIEQIIKLKIFGHTTQEVNICGYMQIIENCESNMILKILNLKMETINQNVSSSQLYKQAGNGIVVTVLEAIFRQMFLVKYDKKPQQTATEQLELF